MKPKKEIIYPHLLRLVYIRLVFVSLIASFAILVLKGIITKILYQ